MRALLLQAFYSIRSERQLVERIDHDLLFRWFVGLGIEDPVWDVTSFTTNRDRLLEGEGLFQFCSATSMSVRTPRRAKLCSSACGGFGERGGAEGATACCDWHVA